jgi:hypothetical protein
MALGVALRAPAKNTEVVFVAGVFDAGAGELAGIAFVAQGSRRSL